MEYDEAHIIQDVLEGKTSRYEYFLDKYGQQVFTLIVRIVASLSLRRKISVFYD